MKNDNETSLIFPPLGRIYCWGSCAIWPIFRIIVGLNLVPHGWGKIFTEGKMEGFTAYLGNDLGFMMPHILAWSAALTELVGGILIALGLLTRPATAAAIILMGVILFCVHLENGFFNNAHGFEYPALWLASLLLVFFYGGKHCSADRMIGREF